MNYCSPNVYNLSVYLGLHSALTAVCGGIQHGLLKFALVHICQKFEVGIRKPYGVL